MDQYDHTTKAMLDLLRDDFKTAGLEADVDRMYGAFYGQAMQMKLGLGESRRYAITQIQDTYRSMLKYRGEKLDAGRDSKYFTQTR